MSASASVWEQHTELARQAHRIGVWSIAVGLPVVALGAWRGNRALLHFGLQNAEWGVTNVGIAWLADRLRDRRMAKLPEPYAPDTLRAEHRRLHRLLLLNTGLDASYVVGGLVLLRWRGRQGHAAGTGASAGIVAQGMALFLHDVSHVRRLGRPG